MSWRTSEEEVALKGADAPDFETSAPRIGTLQMVHRSPDLGLIRTFLTAEEVETLKEAHSAPFDAYERLPRTENASTPSSVGSDSESDASSDSDLPIRSWLVSRDRTTGTRVLSDINARALHVAASSFGFDGPQTPRRPRTFSRRRRRRPPWGGSTRRGESFPCRRVVDETPFGGGRGRLFARAGDATRLEGGIFSLYDGRGAPRRATATTRRLRHLSMDVCMRGGSRT